MADDFPDFVKFEGFAGQAWYHQHMREKRILRRAREFTPERLLEKGEQGVWYDPSDTTTLFQDSAGTTPVTASGQPVGRMLDKSGRGNHATQPTAASRPIYRRGDSRGVVNLLTHSSDLTNPAWSKERGSWANSADARFGTVGTLTEDLSSGVRFTGRGISLSSGVTYTHTERLKAVGRSMVRIQIFQGPTVAADFDLLAGTVSGISGGTASIKPVGDGWYDCSVTLSVTTTQSYIARFYPIAGGSASYLGDGREAIRHAGAQLEAGPTALPYQRNDDNLGGVATGASTDLHWLETDGVDDGMVTGNIDFTGTDKVSVFAGVRKLSDAATAIVCETGTNVEAINGSFALFAPSTTGANSYRFVPKGTALAAAGTGVFAAAPNSSVLTGVGDISAPLARLRRNGAVVESMGTTQGTGNHGNRPLYLFRRGGVSLPFNGWFYGLAITGRLTTDAETAATERFLAAKSAVVIP